MMKPGWVYCLVEDWDGDARLGVVHLVCYMEGRSTLRSVMEALEVVVFFGKDEMQLYVPPLGEEAVRFLAHEMSPILRGRLRGSSGWAGTLNAQTVAPCVGWAVDCLQCLWTMPYEGSYGGKHWVKVVETERCLERYLLSELDCEASGEM